MKDHRIKFSFPRSVISLKPIGSDKKFVAPGEVVWGTGTDTVTSNKLAAKS